MADPKNVDRRAPRPTRDPRWAPDRGFALVIALLVLVALTLPAFALMVSSQREMASTSSEVSRKMATYHADAAAVEGAMWLEGQNALGPPERINQLGISDQADESYWVIRNFGDIGDSDGDTAANYEVITPDESYGAGTAHAAESWFRVSSLPNSSTYVNRVPGEEAGNGVQSIFVVEGLSKHHRTAVRVQVRYAQVYGNIGYQ